MSSVGMLCKVFLLRNGLNFNTHDASACITCILLRGSIVQYYDCVDACIFNSQFYAGNLKEKEKKTCCVIQTLTLGS